MAERGSMSKCASEYGTFFLSFGDVSMACSWGIYLVELVGCWELRPNMEL